MLLAGNSATGNSTKNLRRRSQQTQEKQGHPSRPRRRTQEVAESGEDSNSNNSSKRRPGAVISRPPRRLAVKLLLAAAVNSREREVRGRPPLHRLQPQVQDSGLIATVDAEVQIVNDVTQAYPK